MANNDTPSTPTASAAATNKDAEAQAEPTRGVEFDDTRYSAHKYLVCDDDRGFEEGNVVHVGSGSKVYGPYRLGKKIASGGGKDRFIAFKEGSSNTFRNRPKTKAEIEQENAALLADMLKMKEQLAKLQSGK